MKKQGFTLIEVLIVVTLICILTTLVSVNFSFFNRMLVRSEIQKLHVTCRYLQQCALVDNEPHTLAFDQINNSYTFGKTTEKFPAQIIFGFIPGALGPPSSPSHVISNPITFGGNSIIFHPDGIIKSGTVYLTDLAKSCAYALSSPVSQVSFLRMYRLESGVWQQVD